MNKRGQLFILASVIIAVILITLTTVFNYASSSDEQNNAYDLSYNIKKEGFEVIDYGVYNSKDLQKLLGEYTDNISDYLLNTEPDAEFFFIYGDANLIKVEDYTKPEIVSTISLRVGPTSFVRDEVASTKKDFKTLFYKELVPDSSKKINLTINNKIYQIPINPGQNFIVLMEKRYKNNTYMYIE